MLGTTEQVYDIQTVSEVQPCNGAVAIAFRSGLRATLPAGHPGQKVMLQTVERSLRQQEPVGVVTDRSGRLLEVNHTYRSTVRFVREDEEDSSRITVAFWAFSPVCYLTRDHPAFERIHATLGQAVASGGQVWFANFPQLVEGEAEAWWKIMDVRPAEAGQ
jgi:hypothetical protein